MIVSFWERPTEDEVAADHETRGGRSQLPAAVEALHRAWADALDAADYERARTLKPQLDEEMAAHGFVRPLLADADSAVEEIAPGVFLMDARPTPAARTAR